MAAFGADDTEWGGSYWVRYKCAVFPEYIAAAAAVNINAIAAKTIANTMAIIILLSLSSCYFGIIN